MAVCSAEVSLDLILDALSKFNPKKRVLLNIKINEYFTILSKHFDNPLSPQQIVHYIEVLGQYQSVTEQIPIVANELNSHPKLLTLMNDRVIFLKNALSQASQQQILEHRARALTLVTLNNTEEFKQNVEKLIFLSSLMPIFHAADDKPGLIEKRVNFLFAIAQFLPEILPPLIRVTKLRLYHGTLLPLLAGIYAPQDFITHVLKNSDIEWLPPLQQEDSEYNFQSYWEQINGLIKQWINVIFILGSGQVKYGNSEYNHLIFPFMLARIRTELKDKIERFKVTTTYMELSEEEKSELEHLKIKVEAQTLHCLGTFTLFKNNLEHALSDCTKDMHYLKKINKKEILSSKLIIAYNCDPNPTELNKVVNMLLDFMHRKEAIYLRGSLLYFLATAYRLIRAHNLKGPSLKDEASTLDELLIKNEDLSPHHSAIVSYALSAYSPTTSFFTDLKLSDIRPRHLAILAARIEYLKRHHIPFPTDALYKAYYELLKNVLKHGPKHKGMLSELVNLAKMLTENQYNSRFSKAVLKLIKQTLDSSERNRKHPYYLTIESLFSNIQSCKKDGLIGKIIEQCLLRKEQLLSLQSEFYSTNKSKLHELTAVFPGFKLTPRSNTLYDYAFTKDPELFYLLHHDDVNFCPIITNLGEPALVRHEITKNCGRLIDVVDEINVEGETKSYKRLPMYWKKVFTFLSRIKTDKELCEIKHDTLLYLPHTLWIDLIKKGFPIESARLIRALVQFINQQVGYPRILHDGLNIIYENLFVYNLGLFDIHKEIIYDLLAFMLAHNPRLSPTENIALERINKLRLVYGMERAKSIFSWTEVLNILSGEECRSLKQQSTSAASLLVRSPTSSYSRLASEPVHSGALLTFFNKVPKVDSSFSNQQEKKFSLS